MSFDSLSDYFSDLSSDKKEKLMNMQSIYKKYNANVNLISRKDIQNLYKHHILHSLSIAKFFKFEENQKIIDIGTGGGFPGVPLSIYFDKAKFFLLDSIHKKINTLNQIIQDLKIKNVETKCCRAENIDDNFDFVLGRSVVNIDKFIDLSKKLLKPKGKIIYLNGINDLPMRYKVEKIGLKDIFPQSFFLTKQIVVFSNR